VRNSVGFCYFIQPFYIRDFRGICSSVEMLIRYMVKEMSGIPVIEHIFDIVSVYHFMHVGYTFTEAELVKAVVQ